MNEINQDYTSLKEAKSETRSSDRLKELASVNSASYPDITDADKQSLQDYFRSDNQQLEQYLEREFNWY